MHFTLQDAKYFEELLRKILRATNYIETSLQALPRCDDDVFGLKGITPAAKLFMRIITSQFYQFVKLRRDHCLDKSIQIPIEHPKQLRHSRMLGMRKIFPALLLDEVNKTCVQNLQCSTALCTSPKRPKRPTPTTG